MHRMVECGTWRDGWFEDLKPLEKLVFLYFVTHPEGTPCGAFEVSVRTLVHETGIPEKQAVAIINRLSEPYDDGECRVTWWPNLKTVFVHNWFEHQRCNAAFEVGAARAAAKFKPEIRSVIYARYPQFCGTTPSEIVDTVSTQSEHGIDTVAIQSQHRRRSGQDRTGQIQDRTDSPHTPTGVDSDATPSQPERAARDTSPEFEEFYAAYPRKKAPDDACRAYAKARKKTGVTHGLIMAGLHRARSSVDWAKDNGKFIPYPASWLNGGEYKNVYEAATGPQGGPSTYEKKSIKLTAEMTAPIKG